MNSKDLMVIIIVSIWLLATLITGLLALIFKDKYKNFKLKSDEVNKQLKEAKENFKLQEVKIDYDLPSGEKAYYFNDQVKLNKVEIKNKKAKENYKKEIKESDLKCSIYVTNKRVMVRLNDKYLQYKVENLVKCHYFLKYFKKNWNFLIFFEINDDKYSVEEYGFDLLLALNEISKKEGKSHASI
ncbi:hypothetical protein [Spiroplasma sp. BIUS-1]|uniref:hypothetical protein n=1 Tax=Spiroplasma sp. BIUS-1 TaxID=216964 RepID=UPI00139740D5|nr:hypothetical protein [Spiroplasma sp. BIUS-1]QHX36741.1 hypothetical protein SBIUS_v1c04880 [Spiroplasma sp. BIUS-1]